MGATFDCRDAAEALTGLRLARRAIGVGQLVVIPTDTVYGVAADAFNPAAVTSLLAAKGRGRQSPPPVLVGTASVLPALAATVTPEMESLAAAFWPGGLTMVVPVQSTLAWDLGDTNDTVALRMPDHPIALELLAETGPLAVSSANKSGQPAAVTVAEAREQLGDSIEVYLDAGESSGSRSGSTIVDLTPTVLGKPIRVLRDGTIDRDALRSVVGLLDGDDS